MDMDAGYWIHLFIKQITTIATTKREESHFILCFMKNKSQVLITILSCIITILNCTATDRSKILCAYNYLKRVLQPFSDFKCKGKKTVLGESLCL